MAEPLGPGTMIRFTEVKPLLPLRFAREPGLNKFAPVDATCGGGSLTLSRKWQPECEGVRLDRLAIDGEHVGDVPHTD